MYIGWRVKRSISAKFIDVRFTCQMGHRQALSRCQIAVALILLNLARRRAQHATNRFRLAVFLDKALADSRHLLRRHPADRLAHGIR